MALDKNIINFLNLNKIVKLDNTRSYREGNLMYLTFEIIDKNEDAILSFVFESDRFVNTKLLNIRNIINESKDGHNFVVATCVYKMLLWVIRSKSYSNLNIFEIKDKLKDGHCFYDFMEYISDDLFIQVGNIINNLDFFSLQEKEDYMKNANIINKFANYWEDVIFDNEKNGDGEIFSCVCDLAFVGDTPIDDYIEELFNNGYKYIFDNNEYESWLRESFNEALWNVIGKLRRGC